MKIFFGRIGSDAGGWYWDGHKIVHVPGWNPESMAELTRAVNILREAAEFKTPGLAEAVSKTVGEFVQRELGAHMKDGGVLVIG